MANKQSIRSMAILYGGPPTEDLSRSKAIPEPVWTQPIPPIPPSMTQGLPPILEEDIVEARFLADNIKKGVMSLRLARNSGMTEADRTKLDEIVGKVTALMHLLGG